VSTNRLCPGERLQSKPRRPGHTVASAAPANGTRAGDDAGVVEFRMEHVGREADRLAVEYLVFDPRRVVTFERGAGDEDVVDHLAAAFTDDREAELARECCAHGRAARAWRGQVCGLRHRIA
jgi:hypothetical protein